MDKQTESRSQFEAWVAFQIGHTIEYVKGQRAATTDRYYNEYIDIPIRRGKPAGRASLLSCQRGKPFMQAAMATGIWFHHHRVRRWNTTKLSRPSGLSASESKGKGYE